MDVTLFMFVYNIYKYTNLNNIYSFRIMYSEYVDFIPEFGFSSS